MKRNDPLKILHVTYRFGEDIIGGAEKYLWNLSRHMARKGADITVAATTAGGFHQPTRWNVFWDRDYPSGESHESGLRILRFPFLNHPRWLALVLGLPLQKRFDAEEWNTPPPEIPGLRGGVLGRGWHFAEIQDGQARRWTGPRAEILVTAPNIWQISFTAMCPWNSAGEVFFDGKKAGDFQLSGDFQYFSFKPDPPRHKIRMEIRLKKSRRPLRDLRTLGMMVTSIQYNAGDKQMELPLQRHYIRELSRHKDLILDWYGSRVASRPAFSNRLFDLCRGPWSPGLLRWLKKHIGDYDVVLGHDFPYMYLSRAVRLGKEAHTATAAMPLAHLEDDYYHWSHYYRALGDADVCFSLSDYSRDIFQNRYGARAVTLGGGIDTEEFQDSAIDGRGFRQRHDLGDIPIILYVGRKSQPKRYQSLIRAVRLLSRTHSCRLVMLGPDEDHQPVDPRDALYLGAVERGEILDALDACHLLCLPSESESFGMVITEAWMREKAVIGYSRCGAVASLISDGVDGFLCESDEEMARRMAEILDNPAQAALMGKKGKEKTLSLYTWEKISSRVLDCYREISKG